MSKPSNHDQLVSIAHKMHAACSAVIHYGQNKDSALLAEATTRMDALINHVGYTRRRKCQRKLTT